MPKDDEVKVVTLGEFKLADLVTKPAPRCTECGKPADSWHLLNGKKGPMSVVALACKDHDPGGYWMMRYGEGTNSLANELVDWMDHLEEKSGTKAFETLMAWLQTPPGRHVISKATEIDRRRRSMVSKFRAKAKAPPKAPRPG
jgi:hypothetical protein